MQFLIDDEEAQRVCGHLPTASSFAKFTKVDRGQLAEAIGEPQRKAGSKPGDFKLSDTNSARIADACGFPKELPAWRSGTFEQFRGAYLRHRRSLKQRRTDVPL